ncbi:MAG: hypothetical protein KIS87_14355, partial [Phycisphaeraceae bacterium]|nr:hypothetical protein [Phycisphaeraceae bacterium]
MSTIIRIAKRTTPAARAAFGVALTATAITLVLSPSNAQTRGAPGPAITIEQDGPTLPPLTGTAAVGRVEIVLTDSGRTDPFADDGRPRELAVWIWYPTRDASGPRASYLPPAWAALANNVGPLMQDLTAVSPSAYAGARLDGRPPVVVLMPGLGQPVASYTALAEDLASH